MNNKKSVKPYWEMTTEELREATQEFDEEFVFERTKPLTAEMKSRWERAKNKSEPTTNGKSEQNVNHWFFNTDESEAEGEGAYHEMINESCIAAWGNCRNQGALQMLKRPAERDMVFFYCARRGIIASGEFTEDPPFAADSVFAGDREYHRKIVNLKVLPNPLTFADVLEETKYRLPVRHILCRIKNPSAVRSILNHLGEVCD
jgi:hypothetical protein